MVSSKVISKVAAFAGLALLFALPFAHEAGAQPTPAPAAAPAATSQPDVELRIHVLLASNRSDASAAYPEDLKEVITALRRTLLYKSYTLVTTFVERGEDRGRISASGVAALPGPEGKEPPAIQIECDVRRLLTIEPRAEGAGLVRLENFSLSAVGLHGFAGHASVRTDLTLRPGEKVVVGTSSLGSLGLVVVVSATVVK